MADPRAGVRPDAGRPQRDDLLAGQRPPRHARQPRRVGRQRRARDVRERLLRGGADRVRRGRLRLRAQPPGAAQRRRRQAAPARRRRRAAGPLDRDRRGIRALARPADRGPDAHGPLAIARQDDGRGHGASPRVARAAGDRGDRARGAGDRRLGRAAPGRVRHQRAGAQPGGVRATRASARTSRPRARCSTVHHESDGRLGGGRAAHAHDAPGDRRRRRPPRARRRRAATHDHGDRRRGRRHGRHRGRRPRRRHAHGDQAARLLHLARPPRGGAGRAGSRRARPRCATAGSTRSSTSSARSSTGSGARPTSRSTGTARSSRASGSTCSACSSRRAATAGRASRPRASRARATRATTSGTPRSSPCRSSPTRSRRSPGRCCATGAGSSTRRAPARPR